MSETTPVNNSPHSLPYEDAPYRYELEDLADLTNLVIGDSIWYRRKQARMSETKLGEMVNRDRNFVRLIERGQHATTIAEFKSLAEALDLDHVEFAKEVLDEIVTASTALTMIAMPGVFLIEPNAQEDAQGVAQEDAPSDMREDAQDDSQEGAKKNEKGTFRKTFRKRHKMPPKQTRGDGQKDATGASPKEPTPDDSRL